MCLSISESNFNPFKLSSKYLTYSLAARALFFGKFNSKIPYIIFQLFPPFSIIIYLIVPVIKTHLIILVPYTFSIIFSCISSTECEYAANFTDVTKKANESENVSN